MDKYGPVLEMLKYRNETDWNIVIWIVAVLIFLPVLLYLGNLWRLRIQRQRNRERSFRMLERVATDKGLSFSDQEKLADMVDLAHLKNPALLLDSVDVFDRAVALWMAQVMQLPWLAMEDEVTWVTKIREKVGFRYLPEGFPPSSTRELPVGLQIFVVLPNEGQLRLLSTTVLALDDLALYVSSFKKEKNKVVRVRAQHDLWCFFWSSKGGEYCFESQILKSFSFSKSVFLMAHGNHLKFEPDYSMFACDIDIEVTIEWASAERVNVVPAKMDVFDKKKEEIETLSASINALSSVWFRLDSIEDIAQDDLIRIQVNGTAPAFLSGGVGQVMRSGARGIGCRFLNFPKERREDLMHYLVGKTSVDTFERRLRRTPE